MWETFINGYKNYASYLWSEITLQNDGGFWHNYFWMLILVSLFFFGLEIFKPWRTGQAKFRRDFWLDVFYMFFNFFIFSLIIYNASSEVIVNLFNDGIRALSGFDLQASNPMRMWPLWAVLMTGFVVRDFVQWWVHRLLHRVPRLWEFHKVHHSVKEMGFAAHLRYHWMETIVYRTIEYLPLALLGIGLYDFFLIHIFTLAWGHYNHSNITLPNWLTGGFVTGVMAAFIVSTDLDFGLWAEIGIVAASFAVGAILLAPVMKYLFNSPEMHIWHHAHDIPEHHRYGINFGLTLAIWDYVFGTAEIPHSGRDIVLGFPGDEDFPEGFVSQISHGFGKQ